MKVKLLKSRILVRRDVEETETSTGLFIPKDFRETQSQGEIVAVGVGEVDTDGNLIPMELEVGNSIIFADHVGVEIEVEGKDYLLMNEGDVEAIYEG